MRKNRNTENELVKRLLENSEKLSLTQMQKHEISVRKFPYRWDSKTTIFLKEGTDVEKWKLKRLAKIEQDKRNLKKKSREEEI